jgi:hypothetical protein
MAADSFHAKHCFPTYVHEDENEEDDIIHPIVSHFLPLVKIPI